MGLETTATHAIWFVAIVSIAGITMTAWFDETERLDEAGGARSEVVKERFHAVLSGVSVCHSDDMQKAIAFATNTGKIPLDLLNVSIVLDGVVQPDVEASVHGEPDDTSVWLPGEKARFTIAGIGTEPSRVVIVTQHGVTMHGGLVLCPAGPPARIEITPNPADVEAGGTQQFSATIYDAEGNINTTAPLTWSTTAGTIDGTGLLTAQTTAQDGLGVTATTDGGVSETATVNVVPGPVDSVTVTPSSVTMDTSTTQQFTAAAYDQYGNEVTDATITWSAERGTVDATGFYTAPTQAGSDTVTATADGVSATASVTVTATVHVDDMGTYDTNGTATSTFPRSSTLVTRVTVVDQAGNLVEGATVSIEVVKPNSAVDGTASGTTGADGVAEIQYQLPNGPTGTWTVTVTGITGTNVTYDSAANVVTQVQFEMVR